jgi:hypothetical protein
MIVRPNTVNLLGNSSKLQASTPVSPDDGPINGKDPHRLTRTSHLDPCRCCGPRPSDSDGRPNTPPRNWPVAAHHRVGVVRQLMIKPCDVGRVTL